MVSERSLRMFTAFRGGSCRPSDSAGGQLRAPGLVCTSNFTSLAAALALHTSGVSITFD
jgi:hypothetical protein